MIILKEISVVMQETINKDSTPRCLNGILKYLLEAELYCHLGKTGCPETEI